MPSLFLHRISVVCVNFSTAAKTHGSCRPGSASLLLLKLISSNFLTLWFEILWQDTCEIQWCSLLGYLNLISLGCPLCHLCWFSGCNWFLIVVGSFFGWSLLPAGWLKGTLPTTSCVLLWRCFQNKTTKAMQQTHTCKTTYPLISHYHQQMNWY